MHAAVVIGSAVLGLLVGSLLNVVIDRVPSKAPLRGPRDGEAALPTTWLGLSAQPWVLRGGRSEGGPLPSHWLWVEVATVVVFVELALRYGRSLQLLPLLVLGASLVAVSVVDLQLLRIPDRITFPTLAVALPSIVAVAAQRGETDAIRGALVKLALVMGLYLGWVGWTPLAPVAGPLRLVLYALMLGCVLGVVFGLTVQVATKRKGAFPFGPALALGCLVVVLFASDLRY